MPARLFTRAHFAEFRRVLYENTGIDFGLCTSVDDLGTKIRRQAELIGELAVPPLSNRSAFTCHPSPNWMHPTPVQGRTKIREVRDPSALPVFKSREIRGEVVRFTGASEGELLVDFDAAYEQFLLAWIRSVKSHGCPTNAYKATIDSDDRVYEMKCWPLRFEERGKVVFCYCECT